MADSYRSNYIQVYIWKTLSVLVSFVSFFVVVPYLSSNPQLYGIYTFCISFQLYLTYADIGFLSAGQKYAAEAYARGDQPEERRIFGFVGAVLVAMVLPFSLYMLFLALKPEFALNGVAEENKSLISSLFIILAIVTPIQVLLQRLSASILIIRVKDYISSRIDLIGNIIKILSVFVFFGGGRYMLIPYFLFINIVTILCSIITLHIIRKKENYDVLHFLKSIKFSKKYFNLMKKLAFSSLGATVSWIICYELDLIYIGKIFSVEAVALYAVCFTLINFIRNFFNIIYGPYSQRYNHFVALEQRAEMSSLLEKVIHYTFPLCIFVCVVICFSSKYIILSWVGIDYIESIPLLAVLSWFYVLHFISQPASHVCVSTEQYKIINANSIISPVVFIGSFLILYALGVGIISFAIAKIIKMVVSTSVYYVGIRKWTNIWNDIKSFLPLVLVLLFFAYISTYIYPSVFPDPHKSSGDLFILFIIMGMYAILFGLCMMLIDTPMRTSLIRLINKWKK